ncbi:MAG: hypothetical protein D3903_07165 [Candidatus Electrothrix sp. GM3_4]|nr:hypothetical protein [Candidatus Electrothrix sp. GM3_4]
MLIHSEFLEKIKTYIDSKPSSRKQNILSNLSISPRHSNKGDGKLLSLPRQSLVTTGNKRVLLFLTKYHKGVYNFH